MDEEYDVIVLGTGLKECLLSGVLAVEGMKVLVVDRNDYYGGECGSINLQQLFKKFKNEDVTAENLIARFSPGVQYKTDLDRRRWLHNWQIDLIPKLIMYTGELVQILVKTDVTRYLEFQKVSGSYVFHEGKIHKVPSTAAEAIKSGLMGFFEKRRCAKFLEYCENYKPDVIQTHQGIKCNEVTVEALYDKFGIDANTRSFLGHAVALWPDDKYLKTKPAIETINRILLYRNSLFRLQKSPYVYPRYGLTQLPEAFARLGAVHGSTYILDKNVDEIVYNESGQAIGVRSGQDVAKCKLVIGDPSYFPDKVKVVGKVIRVICVLNHPVPDTDNSDSLQIIIPQKETGRRSDIYVMCLSSDHCVCPAGKYVAIISTSVETDNPLNEISIAFRLLGPVEEKFVNISDRYEPIEDGTTDKCFISKSYDETSHFESTAADVHAMYKRITGRVMDVTPPPPKNDETEEGENEN